MDASTDPANRRGAHTRDLGRGTATATQAVPRLALASVAKALTDAGADPAGASAEGGEASFVKALMANEVLKAQISMRGYRR